MKPHRIRMTHNLVMNYGLDKKMEIYRPHKASAEEMTKFHSDDYIRFLRSIRPDNTSLYNKQMLRFNVGEDCPIFHGLFEFCQLSAGGSIAGAVKLNKGVTEIAINWAGGLHHAKRAEASGFCYVNDIVLAILELLKYHQRVLYVDIDIHHGDGVEEAFYTTDRVMTVSFHKYGDYFPGTGDLRDIGALKGKYYAVNIPLRDGIDDDSFESIFNPIVDKVMETYQPSTIVLQCGADSLTEDRLGCFNLTLKGHAKCVEFVKKYNLPLLLLGGGGYTIRNVARCWTYETAVVLNADIANEIPLNKYFEYYGPEHKLHISKHKMANDNTSEYLDKLMARLFENFRMLPCAPGVEMQTIPEDGISVDTREFESHGNVSNNHRISIFASDKHVTPENELSDSEDEGEGRRNEMSYKVERMKRDEERSSNNQPAPDRLINSVPSKPLQLFPKPVVKPDCKTIKNATKTMEERSENGMTDVESCSSENTDLGKEMLYNVEPVKLDETRKHLSHTNQPANISLTDFVPFTPTDSVAPELFVKPFWVPSKEATNTAEVSDINVMAVVESHCSAFARFGKEMYCRSKDAKRMKRDDDEQVVLNTNQPLHTSLDEASSEGLPVVRGLNSLYFLDVLKAEKKHEETKDTYENFKTSFKSLDTSLAQLDELAPPVVEYGVPLPTNTDLSEVKAKEQ